MTERKVIKAKKKAIRRARLKKAGTVAAMLPLVMSKGAPVATLIRGRHDEEVPGIEQIVEIPEQEIADVVLPETPTEDVASEEAPILEEVEIPEQPETPSTFEAPQTFTAPSFSDGGLTDFVVDEAYLEIAPLNMPWNDWENRDNWPLGTIYSVQWVDEDAVRLEFSTRFPQVDRPGNTFNIGTGQLDRINFRIGVGDTLSENMMVEAPVFDGADRVFITLRGVNPEIYGEVSVYGQNTHKGEESIRLIGGQLRPNPFFPIVFAKEDIRLGQVADKFVGDDVSVDDVITWPRLDLEGLGFRGTFDFTDKIADIVFASTDSAGPAQINYGAVDWESIADELVVELTMQRRLVDMEYEVDIAALQAAFTGTGLFMDAQVRENVPVALQDIHINRGLIPERPFDGTRTVQNISRHISLDFEIQMANGEILPKIERLEVELPREILHHNRAGLSASFVHIEGHNHSPAVEAAVHEAAQALPQTLSEELLSELTQSILTQSAQANGLYDGTITLATTGFTPTIIDDLQAVPDKTFDNTKLVVDGQEEYTFEFAIKGPNPAGVGEVRFATATLVIGREDLKFANSHVGRHKIVVQPYVYKSLDITAGTEDLFSAEDLPAFLADYRVQIEKAIQTLAEQGGLFVDANINQKEVSWTVGRVDSREYDGTTAVTGIVAPELTGFVEGDSNTIAWDFGDLENRLQFARSLPGDWEIEGFNFNESMLTRRDQATGANLPNYKITNTPEFAPATISPLILDVGDVGRLIFDRGEISREYDTTAYYDQPLAPLAIEAITGLAVNNSYRFIFYDAFDKLYFDSRHVTEGFVSVRVTSDFGLQRLGGQNSAESPVQLSPALRDYLRDKLFYGEITPRQVFWGLGQVEDKDYDGEVSARVKREPQLLPLDPTTWDENGIADIDKTGDQRVIPQTGSAEFSSENVAFNTYGDVTGQSVRAIGEWLIEGGKYAENYELVARPLEGEEIGTVGFDLPSQLFGQSAFAMPGFFTAERMQPAFADAVIHPLEVQFTGLALADPSISYSYTGRAIEPDMTPPSLSTVNNAKQDLLDQELEKDRVKPVRGGLIHKNNTQVGTARTALDGDWGIEGDGASNYRLLDAAELEWEIVADKVTAWYPDQVAGAQAGLARRLFDNTMAFSDDDIIRLPRLNTMDLDISAWGLRSFNSPHVLGAEYLTIENPDLVRAQLNDLLGPNQVLADDFDFTSLFAGEITPRILRWENGNIPSRRYNGTDEIIGDITLPSLTASAVGHEIIDDDHVTITRDQTLLEELKFPFSTPGTHIFDWHKDIELRVEFDPIHEGDYFVPEIPQARASILPYDTGDIISEISNFTAESREYDGTVDILPNEFIADVVLEDGTELEIPYLVEGLRFKYLHAGTNELDFADIVFDAFYEYYFNDISEFRELIGNDILEYHEAYITPRRIQWTEGQVFDKEWDDTVVVHDIRLRPDLARADSRLEEVIVARDRQAIREKEGWAEFTASAVGESIPVVSDGDWNLLTDDPDQHPLSNYTFGEDAEAGIVPQPDFRAANIMQVSVIGVEPMPEDPDEELKANVLYIRTGYIERQYTGNALIDLTADMEEEPRFALYNAQGQFIPLSLDNLDNLSVHFQDKDVAYDNGAVVDKPLVTSIGNFSHDQVRLSAPQISSLQDLLFTGRITPWKLSKEDVAREDIAFAGERRIHQLYNGGEDWLVPEEPDPDNAGEIIKFFPEVGIEILETGEIIPIRFGENYEIRFADRHAVRDKQVTIAGFYLDSRNVSLHSELETWMSENMLKGDISPLPIRWTQGQVHSREYDGTEAAKISLMPSLPILAIDKAGVNIHTGTAHFTDVNVCLDSAGNVISQDVQASQREWGISGRYSGNYQLLSPITVREGILPASQAFQTFSVEWEQWVAPLFARAEITPRQLSWTEGQVADKEWDDTDEVHDILQLPVLQHPSGDAIVARDRERITIAEGGARFTQSDIGEDIPVLADDDWGWTTADAANHPLSNYSFGDGQAGIFLQPDFSPANIRQVSIVDVRPMPEDPEEMEVNVLYVKAGRIERRYNGHDQINLRDDMEEKPLFALRNEEGKETIVSLENLAGLQVRFQDKDVAYDNGTVIDKDIVTSITAFNHERVGLSAEQLEQLEELLFTGRITPIRLSFNGRKIAERVFNYDYYFRAEDMSYEYDSHKWIDAEIGQVTDLIGDYYLSITFINQMSRLANGQPHVAEDELIFVDAQGNEILNADVLVELRDEEGNPNRNYEYVFGNDVETIGRITRADGLPVTEPQVESIGETEIELLPSTIAVQAVQEDTMPFVFEPFAFRNAETGMVSSVNLFTSAQAFDPGPYRIEYAISRTDNPEDISAEDWQQSTTFTGLLPATEYYLFARQAEHHNRFEGEISEGLAVVTLGERVTIPAPVPVPDPTPDTVPSPTPDRKVDERAELPRTGDMVASGLGILGLAALASAAILRKKNKKE